MTITVRLFASLRERAGVSTLTRSVPDGTTAGALLAALQEDLPLLRAAGRIALAVNSEYTGAEQRLHDGDELALIPPVSGGCLPCAPLG
jgi:molybdopterin converting factor subunit 1